MTIIPIRDTAAREVTELCSCRGNRAGRWVPFHRGQSPSADLGLDPTTCPEMNLHVSTIENAFLLIGPGRDGVVIDSMGRPLRETCFFTDIHWEEYTLDRLQKVARPLDRDLFLSIDGSWRNYYHWTIIGLGKAMLYYAHGKNQFASVVVDPTTRQQSDWPIGFDRRTWADTLGFALPPQHRLPLEAGVYRVRTLDLMWQTHDQPPFISFFDPFYPGFRKPWPEPSPRGVWRNIIVSRRNDERLSSEGAEALHRLAQHQHFDIVDLERLSFAEQVEVFATARMIVAAHGAGLANLVYAPPTTKVVEFNKRLNGEPHLRPWFALLALGAGQQYSYCDMDRFEGSGGRMADRILELSLL